jgi:cytidylate kinase
MAPGHVFLDCEDVSTAIRTPAITAASSRVAVVPAVRAYLTQQQRKIAAGRNIVCEGRDQGTVVFPDAECKFFLVADALARAQRRHQERLDRGEIVSIEMVLAEQEERDRRDASRDLAPLRPAPDAIVLDTSLLSAAEVLDYLEREVRRCLRG